MLGAVVPDADDEDDDNYLSGFPSGDEELKKPEEQGGQRARL